MTHAYLLTTLLLSTLLGAPGCRGTSHQHKKDTHGTGGLPAQSVTTWTPRTELFMEYEPLVQGRSSKFAAHLTHLDGFKAATDGTLVITLTTSDGTTRSARADRPANPGIFRMVLAPTQAGRCTLSLVYERGGVKDAIDGGACVVHADEAAARKASATEPTTAIAFTKEQQWKTEFGTAVVDLRGLRPSLSTVGELRPAAGREAKLGSPTAGRLVLVSPAPVLGTILKRTQWLATVYPRLAVSGDRATLDAEVRTARAEQEAAELQLARAERLLREQAIPEKAIEEARTRLRVARARLEAALGRQSQFSAGAAGTAGPSGGAFQIRAPIDGTLVSVSVSSGENVEDGTPLFAIIDLTRLWLVARVFEMDLPRLSKDISASFTVAGQPDPLTLEAVQGRLVTIGRVVDPRTRTVGVVFEIQNPGDRLSVGQFASVTITTGQAVQRLVVPASAILDDGGHPVAYVQLEGEAFERRVVRTGVRAEGLVEVLDGLKRHERVVSRGAYELKLAAASGSIPKHGHVH